MIESLKKYWFVYLVGVLLAGFLGYYIVDLNKDNVSSKTADGKSVLASTTLGDITSDEVYDSFDLYSTNLLYAMYRNAVVDQAIPTTSEMETQAKTFQRNVESNLNADATDATRVNIISELAGFGFLDISQLYDYSLMTLKTDELDRQYIDSHFDELKDLIETSPRTVSILTMEVDDPDNLSEEELDRQQEIEEAIEQEGFESAAAAYSEDLDTVANNGFFGYIDSSSTDLDSAVIEAATGLEKDETSDWIAVTDSNTGISTLYKVHVNETDLRALFDDENSEVSDKVIDAFISADSLIEMKAVVEAAEPMNISFDDEAVDKRLNEYIDSQIGEDESELAEDDGEVAIEKENTDQDDQQTDQSDEENNETEQQNDEEAAVDE